MGEPNAVGAAGSPATARPRLGELLVQRGLLTPDQLGEALAEQQASGLPLGAILVRDGLVASHTIAILLAEQSGGPLKTEFGYAVGTPAAEPAGADVLSLRPPPAPMLAPGPPVSDAPADGLRLAVPESPPEIAPAVDAVQARREVLAVAPEAPQQGRREIETQLHAEVAARTALEQKLADIEAGTEAALAGQAALEAKVGEVETRTEAALAGRTALEAKVTELEARLQEALASRHALEQDMATLRERADEAEANACATQTRHATLHDRLAALELRSEELDAVRAADARSSVQRPYTSERHILLAPVDDHYELVERPGPPPEAGSRIDLFENRSFLVVRVGPAPIPGALEACAYLEPIPTRLPPPDADTEPT
jgi:hypothetical protein